MVRRWIVPCLFLFLVTAEAQNQQIRIGDIEFFGTKNIDVSKAQSSLSIHEGQEVAVEAMPRLISDLKIAIKKSTGKDPTDVAPVCCNVHDDWIIYIGLGGTNVETFHYNSPPTGSVRFPSNVVSLYEQTLNLLMDAVHAQATEDRSRGYALSSDPPLRAKQLAMRDYAIHHDSLIRRVLNESSDEEHRIVAAQLLGYTKHNKLQITSLVKASHDSSDGVRNNAVRALVVLAQSGRTIANKIPAEGFVGMLNSGVWKDRNKSLGLLGILTMTRDETLLKLLDQQAADSLIEMAQWREPGHAESAQLILGRVAGIEETQLKQLLDAHDAKTIIRLLSSKPR